MEDPKRATSPKSVRGSKITQTFSRFKGFIRAIPARKVTSNAPNATPKSTIRENRGRTNQQSLNHPYSRTSIAMKPYMSQPMLALQRSSADTNHSQPSDPDSDATSVNPSPTRLNSEFPLPTVGTHPYNDARRHSRTLSSQSLSSPLLEDPNSHQTVPNSKTLGEIPQRMQNSQIQPSLIGLPKGTPQSPASTPRLKSEQLPPNTQDHHLKRRPHFPPAPHPIPNLVAANGSAASHVPKSSTKTLPSTPNTRPPIPQRPLPPVPPAGIVPASNSTPLPAISTPKPPLIHHTPDPADRNENTLDARSKQPAPITYSPGPVVPSRKILSSSHQLSWSAHEPRTLVAAETFTRSSTDGEAWELVDDPTGKDQGKERLPMLTMPTSLSRRMSMIAAAEGAARLSPSIMHRPMPLPIMNLPRLPVTPSIGETEGTSVGRRRSERIGLGSMPALPLQGTNRGVGGHEEVDDMEDDDEEEDLEDLEEDSEEEQDGQRTPNTGDSQARTSTSSGGGSRFSGEDMNSRGSYEFRPLESLLRPELPPLSLSSPLDIRFHGPASSTPTADLGGFGNGFPSDKKGKNKQVSVPLGSERDLPEMGASYSRQGPLVLPQASHSFWEASSSSAGGDYFSPRLIIPEPQEFARSHSQGSDRTLTAPRPDPFAANESSSSPLATPRPMPEPMPRPRRVATGGLPNSNRNSFVFGGGNVGSLLVQRPSMYKRASRSLIDIHEIEKKEEVERMVREGEEEQEREHRRRSMRRSVILSPEGDVMNRNSIVQHDRLGTMAEEETLPKQAGETTNPTSGPSTQDPLVGGSGVENGVVSGLGAGMVGGNRTGRILETSAGGVETMKRQNRISVAPAYEDSNPLPLRKRRSMPTFNETTAPPPYPSFAPHPYGLQPSLLILPREDEGREVLPAYSNSISLRAIMPRKVEFSAPGVQAKDRKWKRVLCVLEGTMLNIYRCPVGGSGGVSAIEQWWESKVGAGDVALYAATNGPGSTAAAASKTQTEEEEKMNQRYLRNPLHNEPRLDSGSQQPVVQQVAAVRSPPSSASIYGSHMKGHAPPVAMTKSALSLAVQFLKPGSRHMRSTSDSGPPSPVGVKNQAAPRPSLNLPSGGPSTPSSRSQSPMPSSSSSATHGSRSHSPMPSQSSSRLTIPSTSSDISPRPVTPTSGNSGRSSRLRHGAPKTGRSDSSRKSESSEPSSHNLLRSYTMQNAESGLGNDYVKRKNVIRVRLEGEQFLLQASDVAGVVQWIEGLQAATNIALDLDERPMPRGPIFPRRRRRRRPNVPAITTTGAQAPASTVIESYTPTSATAGQPALRRE